MKANHNKLITPSNHAFHIRKDIVKSFNDKWHFHDMLELVYIIKGNGERYIGDSIDSFNDGDIVLVGSKLPHVWRSLPNLKNKKLKKNSAIVIQFPADFLGDKFLELSESTHLKALFQKAQRGIVFNTTIHKKLGVEIANLLNYKGMKRLTHFITLLYKMAITNDYTLLASPHFIDTIYRNDEKINTAFEYIINNFIHDIKLSDIASEVGMNKTAFCRYFKNKTKKTFTNFLNEVKIGYACKLLREDHSDIQTTIYKCGYSSPSYFYKNFKDITGISPTEYQVPFK
jgi:AraC-like DNA-binding protein